MRFLMEFGLNSKHIYGRLRYLPRAYLVPKCQKNSFYVTYKSKNYVYNVLTVYIITSLFRQNRL